MAKRCPSILWRSVMIWHLHSDRLRNLGFPPPSISAPRPGSNKSAPIANAKRPTVVTPGPFYGRSAHSPRTSHASY